MTPFNPAQMDSLDGGNANGDYSRFINSEGKDWDQDSEEGRTSVEVPINNYANMDPS